MNRFVIKILIVGAAVAAATLAGAGTAFAFGGCADSPENPTWLLAGIGGVAAGVPWLRAKLKRRK